MLSRLSKKWMRNVTRRSWRSSHLPATRQMESRMGFGMNGTANLILQALQSPGIYRTQVSLSDPICKKSTSNLCLRVSCIMVMVWRATKLTLKDMALRLSRIVEKSSMAMLSLEPMAFGLLSGPLCETSLQKAMVVAYLTRAIQSLLVNSIMIPLTMAKSGTKCTLVRSSTSLLQILEMGGTSGMHSSLVRREAPRPSRNPMEVPRTLKTFSRDGQKMSTTSLTQQRKTRSSSVIFMIVLHLF
mmetsp:Transcript_98698/g.155992  ORF Transcript_98698/g.155992 Transcript_98698/m.155992 type:complete len:243 (+) Transcript_98698:568-1296(+)